MRKSLKRDIRHLPNEFYFQNLSLVLSNFEFPLSKFWQLFAQIQYIKFCSIGHWSLKNYIYQNVIYKLWSLRCTFTLCLSVKLTHFEMVVSLQVVPKRDLNTCRSTLRQNILALRQEPLVIFYYNKAKYLKTYTNRFC